MSVGKTYDQAKELVKHLVATPDALALVVTLNAENRDAIRAAIIRLLPFPKDFSGTEDRLWFDLAGSRREIKFVLSRQPEAVRGICPTIFFCEEWVTEVTPPRAEKSPN